MFMEDSIKGVISIIIKMMVIIASMYIVFNVVAFISSYFRIMGASYSLQQIVMENNYLPEAELNAFQGYLDSIETTFTPDMHVVVFTDRGPGETDSFWRLDEDSVPGEYTDYESLFNANVNERVQYGTTIYVGVCSDFKAMFPFMFNETIVGEKVAGYSGTGGDFKSDAQLQAERKYSRAHIDVVQPVVGLQYYSDLEN